MDTYLPGEARDAVALMQRLLGDRLLGIYLHGSIIGSGLRRHSDIDLLAVVNDRLSTSMRRDLIAEIMACSGHYPREPSGKRPLEIIIFHAGELVVLPYPVRAELLYGEWLRGSIESGALPENEADAEFTLLLAQARNEAVPLIGPSLADLMPAVSVADIRRASADLLPRLTASVRDDARNVILTLARMWRTLATGDFVSKDAAADWAMARTSRETAEVLATARDAYLGAAEEPLWQDAELDEAVKALSAHIGASLPPETLPSRSAR